MNIFNNFKERIFNTNSLMFKYVKELDYDEFIIHLVNHPNMNLNILNDDNLNIFLVFLLSYYKKLDEDQNINKDEVLKVNEVIYRPYNFINFLDIFFKKDIDIMYLTSYQNKKISVIHILIDNIDLLGLKFILKFANKPNLKSFELNANLNIDIKDTLIKEYQNYIDVKIKSVTQKEKIDDLNLMKSIVTSFIYNI